MSYWLCFAPHVACTGQCTLCLHRNLPVEVHVIQAVERPMCALNGPCDDPQELLGQMSTYFEFGLDGRLKLKRGDTDE